MLISVLNYKGGQGKSLWSAILADWADAAELLDLDPRQGDSSTWAEDAGRPARQVWAKDAPGALKAAAAENRWFVADCPPHEGVETRAALEHSHLVVIPLRPAGSQDARAWGRIQAALTEARQVNPGLKAAVVLNESRATAVARDFAEMLKEWHQPRNGQAVLGAVPLRVALAEAFAAGRVPRDEAVEAVLAKLSKFCKQ